MLLLFACLTLSAQSQAPLTLETHIPLPNVQGRIDHLAVDIAGNRLFVAALGNNTVEVIDLRQGRRIRTLTGMRKPQGVLWEPESRRLFVASGDDGVLRVFDGEKLSLLHQLDGLPDADNVRWDAVNRRVLVGYGEGAVGVLDTEARKLGDIALPVHPESFQLDAAGGRLFVNVPDKQRVIVLDLNKRSIAAEWPISVKQNFPMSFDPEHNRLFLGARQPAKLLVLDSEKGRAVASISIVADTDDLFYDPKRQRLYAIGGGGAVTVIHQDAGDKYRAEATVSTAPGARTGLFAPDLGKLFVAAPRRGGNDAQVLVYRAD